MTGRRVVITGLEVLAPGGIGAKSFWRMLSAGRPATRKITFFDPSPLTSLKTTPEIDPVAALIVPDPIASH